MISTWSFGQRANRAAWPALASGGSSLDAVETACITVERDPSVDSIGLGGLPDASGEVTLDAAVMLSPQQRGSVCYVRNYLDVTSLARKVMENTPHVLLAGDGAEAFAHACGLAQSSTLSDDARAAWHTWKQSKQTPDQSRDAALHELRPIDVGGGALFGRHTSLAQGDDDQPRAANDESRWSNHDTIGVLALDARGTLAGACSTSGAPYKLPGRVGDSPIIGHGLYVEPDVAAVTATGTGELVMATCGSFLVAECIRRGASAAEAITIALERVNSTFQLSPRDQVAFIALLPDGATASGALRAGFKVAIHSSDRDVVVDPDVIIRDD